MFCRFRCQSLKSSQVLVRSAIRPIGHNPSPEAATRLGSGSANKPVVSLCVVGNGSEANPRSVTCDTFGGQRTEPELWIAFIA